ncbi:MAG: BLUF domain-containing protein [Pseudomonadota bacterium]
MKQLIYRSQPFGFDDAMLAGILMDARRNNACDGITGALICRHDLYLQLIEGPAAAIDALYGKIAVDARHLDVRPLLSEEVAERMFPDWAMLDDEAPSLFWSPDEVVAGVLEAAGPAALRGAFAGLTGRS